MVKKTDFFAFHDASDSVLAPFKRRPKSRGSEVMALRASGHNNWSDFSPTLLELSKKNGDFMGIISEIMGFIGKTTQNPGFIVGFKQEK